MSPTKQEADDTTLRGEAGVHRASPNRSLTVLVTSGLAAPEGYAFRLVWLSSTRSGVAAQSRFSTGGTLCFPCGDGVQLDRPWRGTTRPGPCGACRGRGPPTSRSRTAAAVRRTSKSFPSVSAAVVGLRRIAWNVSPSPGSSFPACPSATRWMYPTYSCSSAARLTRHGVARASPIGTVPNEGIPSTSWCERAHRAIALWRELVAATLFVPLVISILVTSLLLV